MRTEECDTHTFSISPTSAPLAGESSWHHEEVSEAARLFDLELTQRARLLDPLVEKGLLWTNGRELLGPNVGRRLA
jgi:hypothetical protein